MNVDSFGLFCVFSGLITYPVIGYKKAADVSGFCFSIRLAAYRASFS